MLDGMLFSGPLSLKLNRDLQQWIRLCLVIRMNLVCTAFLFIHVFRAGPRHKRTKWLLRAPWPPEGPQVAYMKLQFILFYFILIREMSMDSGNYTNAQY